MRIIPSETIFKAIYHGICEITYHCDPIIVQTIAVARAHESDARAADVLDAILLNNEISPIDNIPLCQDTGSTVIFAETGNEVLIPEHTLQEIADAAVAKAQQDCPLRASIVRNPLFSRENSQNNSPAILHISQVKGNKLKLRIAQKGGGAENMSFLLMLNPATALPQIKKLLVEKIIASGSKACPPLVVGIGIGGNFERCALLAKQALLVKLGRSHPEAEYAKLEHELLQMINAQGCGAQGMGGKLTALAVHILHEPCHIASLPIAVNLQCHVHRHIEVEL
jgi:fumarate hydratase subunit alpha